MWPFRFSKACSNNSNWAEPVSRELLTLKEKALGSENPQLALDLHDYAFLLRKVKRRDEAAEVEARIERIRSNSFRK